MTAFILLNSAHIALRHHWCRLYQFKALHRIQMSCSGFSLMHGVVILGSYLFYWEDHYKPSSYDKQEKAADIDDRSPSQCRRCFLIFTVRLCWLKRRRVCGKAISLLCSSTRERTHTLQRLADESLMSMLLLEAGWYCLMYQVACW